jgi:membrane-bound lytic murein transglycosylase B
MGLFYEILNAVNNPNQQGSPDQLGAILNTIQQVAGSQGLDASSTQGVLSVVGGYVRSALQQQRATGGNASVEALLNQFSGTHPNPNALQALFTPNQQQQVAQAAAQRTGVDANTILALLPVLVPVVLNLLKTGTADQANPQANPQAANQPGGNSVLNTFLDSDGDGDVDVGDVMSLANRFLNQPR